MNTRIAIVNSEIGIVNKPIAIVEHERPCHPYGVGFAPHNEARSRARRNDARR